MSVPLAAAMFNRNPRRLKTVCSRVFWATGWVDWESAGAAIAPPAPSGVTVLIAAIRVD